MPVPTSTEILESVIDSLPDTFKYEGYRDWIPSPPRDEYHSTYGVTLSQYEFLKSMSEELQITWQDFSDGLKIAAIMCTGGVANRTLLGANATASPGLLISTSPFALDLDRLQNSLSSDKFAGDKTPYLTSMLRAISSSLTLYLQLWILAWFRVTTYNGGTVNWTMPGTAVIPGSWTNQTAFSSSTGFQDGFGNYLRGGQSVPLNVDTMANFAKVITAGISWWNTNFYVDFLKAFFTGFVDIWNEWILNKARLSGGRGIGIGMMSPGLIFGIILNTEII